MEFVESAGEVDSFPSPEVRPGKSGPSAALRHKCLQIKNMHKKATENQDQVASDAAELLRFGKMAYHLIEVLPLGVVVFDHALAITDINPAAREILPADQDSIADALACGATDQSADHWRRQLRSALTEPHTSTFENVAYNRHGQNYILRILCTPLGETDNGAPMGGIMLIEDMSRRVAMENDLASAERLAAVGKLAARIAHELNNPLDGIIRYLNLALRLTDEQGDDQAGRYLREARKGLQRMVQILSELLEFSRNTYSACEEADINKIVVEALKAMDSQAHKGRVQVITRFSEEMANVRSGNLFQVFCNLIKNAIDAMENTGGQLLVSTSYDGRTALVQFADEGIGLSTEVLEKMFDPFFTTKQVGKGTGLGLAICRDIIERYGGAITAENRSEGGSLFTVSIPVEPQDGVGNNSPGQS